VGTEGKATNVGAPSERVIIRPAQLAEAAQIAQVHVDTWQFAYKGLIPDSILSSLSVEGRTRRWDHTLAAAGIDTQTFVAELDGRVVGFCSVGPCRDEDLQGHEFGELLAVYVSPDSMKNGIGSALALAGLAFLRKNRHEKATLWVLTSNLASRTWYEKRGWAIEGGIKTDVIDGFEMHEARYWIVL
jgi:ribosomal protein S18 acetylase RimI-like enzyme